MRRSQTALDPARVEEARRLYVDEGLSERAIANLMDISRWQVRQLLAGGQVAPRPVGRPRGCGIGRETA